MTETKHANHIPAPWAFEPENNGLPVIVDASGNDIALVRDGWDGMTTYAKETITANSHMLRASPELYAALDDVLGSAYMRDPGGERICRFCLCGSDPDPSVQADHYLDCPVVPAEAALRKARGEA